MLSGCRSGVGCTGTTSFLLRDLSPPVQAMRRLPGCNVELQQKLREAHSCNATAHVSTYPAGHAAASRRGARWLLRCLLQNRKWLYGRSMLQPCVALMSCPQDTAAYLLCWTNLHSRADTDLPSSSMCTLNEFSRWLPPWHCGHNSPLC